MRLANFYLLLALLSYALIGVGVHGTNGLDPVASHDITRIFILSRLDFGLQATMIPNAEHDKLNKFYHNQLRVIQALPVNTARVAVCLLLGALPFEALYNRHVMTLYGSAWNAQTGYHTANT